MATQGKVLLRAEARQLVQGKLYLRGDLFYVDEDDADDLVAVHFATRVPPKEKPAPAVVTALQLVADESVHPSIERKAPARGRYARRDLRSDS